MIDNLSINELSKDEILIEETYQDLVKRIFSGFANEKEYHVVDSKMNKYLDEIEESI